MRWKVRSSDAFQLTKLYDAKWPLVHSSLQTVSNRFVLRRPGLQQQQTAADIIAIVIVVVLIVVVVVFVIADIILIVVVVVATAPSTSS